MHFDRRIYSNQLAVGQHRAGSGDEFDSGLSTDSLRADLLYRPVLNETQKCGKSTGTS
jgi:hypothetical protein